MTFSKLIPILLFIISINSNALEVVKPEFKEKLILKIVRVMPDGYETFSLANHNGREMTLVCARNRVYDNNSNAFIEYRNFYNEVAGHFLIEENQVCKDMGKFIEAAHSAVDENRPFVITLNKKTMRVEKIIYPNVDPLADKGLIKDLLLKPEVLLNPQTSFKLY